MALVVATGCAQIKTTHNVTIVPKQGAEPVVLGSPHGQVAWRGLEASWSQDQAEIELTLVETRTCAAIRHEPVIRIDRIERTTGGALYWEYGLAAATLSLGLTALLRPQLFAPTGFDANGDRVQDLRPGYRIGGIFSAIGAGFLAAGIYDTVRARDETVYVDAYRVHRGEDVPCASAAIALVDQEVELIAGEFRAGDVTDAEGRVRLPLPDMWGDPGETELPETERPATEVPAPEVPAPPAPPETVTAVIRIDEQRALAFDFVVPYDHPDAVGHAGQTTIEPIRVAPPSVPPPPLQ
jgi:hypothetical protein